LIFLDASAAAKRYFPEAGSARIAELLSTREPHCSLALLLCELASALNRRLREGDISRATYRAARDQIEDDAIAISAVRVDDEVIRASLRLLDLHPLKILDSLYLAAALNLQKASTAPVLFVSADRHLLRAARAEGLQVLDPEAV